MSGILEIKKEKVLDALKDLPDKGALPEFIERLYILYKLQKGIDAADAGNVITLEEAKQRFRKWLV